MRNLISVLRPDKNGKLVTRHVLPDQSASLRAATIPAPAINVAQTFTPTKSQLNQKTIKVTGRNVVASIGIAKALNMRDKPFSFTASDVEAYDVLSVLGTANAAAMLAHGTRSAEEAKSFLQRHNLEFLIVDNKEIVGQALQRGIPASRYLKVSSNQRTDHLPSDQVLDAAEALAITGQKNALIWEDVLKVEIRLSDVKKIGAKRIGTCSTKAAAEEIREFLKGLKKHDVNLDEDKLYTLLDKGAEPGVISMAPNLVKKFGYEQTVSFHSYRAADAMWKVLRFKDDDYMIPRVIHFDAMARVSTDLFNSGIRERNLSWSNFQFAKATDWHDAGLTPEESVEVHRGITTMERILEVKAAMADGSIVPAVSDGWL